MINDCIQCVGKKPSRCTKFARDTGETKLHRIDEYFSIFLPTIVFLAVFFSSQVKKNLMKVVKSKNYK